MKIMLVLVYGAEAVGGLLRTICLIIASTDVMIWTTIAIVVWSCEALVGLVKGQVLGC